MSLENRAVTIRFRPDAYALIEAQARQENYPVSSWVKAHILTNIDELEALKAARDALLAACEALLVDYLESTDDRIQYLGDQAKAAIKLAKEGSRS